MKAALDHDYVRKIDGQNVKKGQFLCRDSVVAARLVLDLVLFLDLAQIVGMKGIQEWLSCYFKGPMIASGLYPEHDIFIQVMKLKNPLRWMQGET